MRPGVRIFVRVAATGVVAFGTALVVAVALGVYDLYLTGHSLPSLMRPWIEMPGSGISMSRADVVLWVAVLAAGTVAWWASGLVTRPPASGPGAT